MPAAALKHIGPAEPLGKKTGAGEGTTAAAPAGGQPHTHTHPHPHRSMGEAVRCVSQCAVRCIHDHMPGHQPRAPPKMREEEAKKWLIAKRKDFARYRCVHGSCGGVIGGGFEHCFRPTHTNPPKQHNHSMVCFPYAGGNSNFYKTWDFKDTEMILVELPGRNACVPWLLCCWGRGIFAYIHIRI